MDQLIYLSIFGFAAFALAMTVVFVIGGTIHLGSRSDDGFLLHFFGPMLLTLAVLTLTSGRDLAFPDEFLSGVAGPSGASKWIQRLTTAFLMAASIERIAAYVLGKHDPRKPQALMWGYILFWVCSVAIPAAFGTRPVLSHEYIYSLLIGVAALLSSETAAERAIKVARSTLLLFMIASLAAIAYKKSLVLAPYAGGIVPGFSLRYSGLATGPNAMGPMALVGMMALWCYPYRHRGLLYFAWAIAIVTLVLTQSKTSWLATIACFGVLLAVRARGHVGSYLADPRKRGTILLLLGAVAAAIVLAMLLVTSGLLGAKIQKLLSTKLGADLTSMTGRNEIWALAIDEWRRNLLFGYGPTIWDPLYRFQMRSFAAFHAHNQVLNILAASGLVGLFGFLVYFGTLVKRLLPRLTAYGGFPAALFVLLMIRAISEVPLNLQSFTTESIFHMLLLMTIGGAAAAAPKPRALQSLQAQHAPKARHV